MWVNLAEKSAYCSLFYVRLLGILCHVCCELKTSVCNEPLSLYVQTYDKDFHIMHSYVTVTF